MTSARVVIVGVLLGALVSGCSRPAHPPAARPVPPATPSFPSALPVSPPSASPPPGDSPRVSKVLTIVEENHSLAQMQRWMPYLYSVATRYAYATGYTAVGHPSLPNYLALSGGSSFGIGDDANPSAHPISGASVFGQALATGKTAKVYAESMATNCASTDAGSYAVRHTGWPYYADEQAACQAGQVPMGSQSAGALAADVTAGALPSIGWAIPNLDHDAHDGTLAQADNWLGGWLPQILAGPDFTHGRLAVVITADEDDSSSGNRVLTVVAAAGLTGQVVTVPLTHYSLTGLYDDIIGVARLRNAATAPSFAAAFTIPVRP